MKNYCLIAFAFLIFQFTASAQVDTLSETLYAEPDFKGFQVDASTILLINTIGTAMDIDFIKNFKDPSFSIGIRFGGEFCNKTTKFNLACGANTGYVNFFDFNLYPRLTTDNKVIRIDSYAGIGFHLVAGVHNSPESQDKDATLVLKGGADIKIKLYKNYFGILLKVVLSTGESMFGIGLFGGFGNEYKNRIRK